MSGPATSTVSATRSRTGGWRFWLSAHASAAAEAGRHLRRRPGTYLVTVVVLATVLALPLAFYVALKNLDRVFAGIDSGAQVSVFLETAAPAGTLDALLATLERDGRVAGTEVITREQALADFSAREEFAAALAALDQNPFPDLVVITPAAGLDGATMTALVDELQGHPGVGFAQLD
ncbi:MAG: hypothetical protein HKO62_13465, partial [Gammaproteobacteria bacterium]|nr:hypothetical protein [Gammaproteobacteria bacterium]